MSKHEPTSFEEALNLTGFGKFNILKSMLCSSIIVGMVFEIFSVSFLVPASSCELNTSSSQQGILAAMPLLGIIATSHFWGYLADTRGRKKVLQVSMAMAFVGGCVATFATNWIFYGVFKVLSSSSVSGAFALSITLLSECTPEEKRSRLLLFTNSIFFLCNGVMAVLAIPVLPLEFSYYVPGLGIQFNSWRLLNFLYCLPCLFCAIGLIFAYESPRFLLSIGEEEKALEVLRAIYVINNNKSSEEYPVKSVTLNEDKSNEKPRNFFSLMIAQTVPLFKPPLLRNTLLLSTLFVIVYVCLNPFLVWMPLMADGFMKSLDRGDEGLTFCQRLQTSFNTTNVQEDSGCTLNSFAMTLVFIIGVLLAFINTLIVGVSNYVGRKSLLISLQMLAGVSALLVNASSSWVLSAILFVAFISGVLNYGFLSTFAVDIFPTYVKAMAVCLTLMMGRGSAVFGINLLKYMLDNQCEESFYIFGSITIVGGILGFLLPEDKKPKQRKCPET